MNESSNSPEPSASTGPQPVNPENTQAPANNSNQANSNITELALTHRLQLAVAALALLLIAQWWNARSDITHLREEMARRLQSSDSTNTATNLLAKSVQESMQTLQTKVNQVESKQTEAQSQQLALEQLYQDLSKNRDEWTLSEIEQVLSTASQQLQLSGNVPGALIALQNADKTLSRSDKPQFITIRRAISKDIEVLKSLPNVDLAGMTLRLDSVINQIDDLPLLSDEKPTLPAMPPKKVHKEIGKSTKNVVAKANDTWMALKDQWQSVVYDMGNEIRQLIRVRRVDTADALLMSPTQAYFVRESVKLRLLNARLSLLSRNESAFHGDMVVVQDAIAQYFDVHAKPTQVVRTLLKQMQNSNLSIEMPTLSDSLNAVRSYKTKP